MWKEVYNVSYLKNVRKDLRNNSTAHERKLWEFLKWSKFYSLKFRRQYSVNRYVIDFYCHSKKVGIELDGKHHLQEDILEYDKIRTEFLESSGIRIIRIENSELDNMKEVLNKLYNFIF